MALAALGLSPTSDGRRHGQVSLVLEMHPHKNPTLGVGEGRNLARTILSVPSFGPTPRVAATRACLP